MICCMSARKASHYTWHIQNFSAFTISSSDIATEFTTEHLQHWFTNRKIQAGTRRSFWRLLNFAISMSVFVCYSAAAWHRTTSKGLLHRLLTWREEGFFRLTDRYTQLQRYILLPARHRECGLRKRHWYLKVSDYSRWGSRKTCELGIVCVQSFCSSLVFWECWAVRLALRDDPWFKLFGCEYVGIWLLQ